MPYELAYSHGSLHKNMKSELLDELETKADVLRPPIEEPLFTACVIDEDEVVRPGDVNTLA